MGECGDWVFCLLYNHTLTFLNRITVSANCFAHPLSELHPTPAWITVVPHIILFETPMFVS